MPSILRTCGERGIKRLGITDHIYPRTDRGILAETRAELESIRSPVKAFLGCEADVLTVGVHTVTDEMRSSLDFIAVAANHFHADFVAQPANDGLETVAEHFMKMFRYACSLEFADYIAHPLFVYPNTFDPTCLELITDRELRECIDKARTNGIAMEISPRALVRDQLFFRMHFYTMCKEARLKFSIGSDAHSLNNVGAVGVLAPLIRELGITDDDIWLPEEALGGQA